MKKINEFIEIPENKRFIKSVEIFKNFFEKNFNLTDDKNMVVFVTSDDTLLVEWIFKDFRFGFSMEKDLNESNWYFVSNRKFGGLTVSGLMNDPISSELIKIINQKVF